MTGPAAADVVVRLVHAVDALDWDGVRACFADELVVDYRELSGDPAATVPADALVEQWQGLLPGFDATQHLLGPVLVRGSADGRTTLECHVRGYHHLTGADGPRTWGVHGNYVVEVVDVDGQQRISALTLQVSYQDGDLSLPDVARRRAGEAPQGPRRPTGG